MGWPFHFLKLDEAQLLERRQTLDEYGLIAQLSALVPVALILLYRLIALGVAKATGSRGTYAAIPGSPTLKQERSSLTGSLAARGRRIAWWFGGDIVLFGRCWGQRDQMIAGVCWGIWLLVLCVVDTRHDYIHLARRFTNVAVSQFPVQYLLSLKSLNPFALALNSSHEELNRWHRTLGRVIYVFMVAHVLFYLNYYYQHDILRKKLTALTPALGLVMIASVSILYFTALAAVRAYSYRVFFITHFVVALALPPLIYFHAGHATIYLVEAVVVILLDIANRRLTSVVADTRVELVPGTDLVKLVGSIPAGKIDRFARNPGTHVYVSIPAASRPNRNFLSPAHLVFEVAFNPFSVASADESSGEITLVARRHNGPMTRAFAHFADAGAAVKLAFDGPYGCAKRFPNLAGPGFDRVLLVAGGVGATFILPLYRWILSENAAARVQMVWAVRAAGDVTWALADGEKSIIEDENVQLFITGSQELGKDGRLSGGDDDDDEVELASLSSPAARLDATGRLDLRKIVDDTFKLGVEERVAVLVCGPEAMARELRVHVGGWVERGRYVWWHSENFAW